ncbi:hypothetical protein D3C73_577230 [compost metagenome]
MLVTTMSMHRRFANCIQPPRCQEDLQWHDAPRRFQQAITVEVFVQPSTHPGQVRGVDQIDFIQQQQIGERNLTQLEFHLLGGFEHLSGIDDTGDAVQTNTLAQGGVGEGDRDACRVGNTAGFEDHIFGLLRAHQYLLDRLQQVVAHRTAHATIGQADHVTVNADDQFSIDVQRAEVVDQHGNTQAMVFAQQTIKQSGLAGPQKTGQHGQRSGLGGGENVEI